MTIFLSHFKPVTKMSKIFILELKHFIHREIRKRNGDPDVGDGTFRERHTPEIKFKAKTLKDLIAWDDVLDEPVLTTDIPTGTSFIHCWKTD